MSQASGYGKLAECYDELFAPFRVPLDAARNKLLRWILPRAASACDLACGTGTTALELARRGLRTFAVDLSPAMCRITRRKAAEAGLPIRVLRGDMRSFVLPEPVDLVTCEYDAINHVPRRADLREVAQSVYGALRPGGHFFFDANNAFGFERYWTGTFVIERTGVLALMRSAYDRKDARAHIDLDLFVRKNKCWQRYSERVGEVCWEPAEIQRVLEATGFEDVRTWDAAPFFPKGPVVAGCRNIWLARKPAATAAAATGS